MKNLVSATFVLIQLIIPLCCCLAEVQAAENETTCCSMSTPVQEAPITIERHCDCEINDDTSAVQSESLRQVNELTAVSVEPLFTMAFTTPSQHNRKVTLHRPPPLITPTQARLCCWLT